MKNIKIVLLVLLSFSFLYLFGCQRSPFKDQVKNLLDDTKVKHQLVGCAGGMFNREMSCEVIVSEDDIDNFVLSLGLNEDLPYFKGEKRLIVVSDNQLASTSALREKYSKAFGAQQWNPSRHGFASVIFFYNKKTELGCLFLSIAYG
tara:strand:- start:250 stop:690 length:441 start_codon:yes stop_codon:yes gene_type:complete